jgi:hypothetical protein
MAVTSKLRVWGRLVASATSTGNLEGSLCAAILPAAGEADSQYDSETTVVLQSETTVVLQSQGVDIDHFT